MFKLLTEEGREKVGREYRTRRVVVLLVLLVQVLAIGIIGLLPSYILSSARQDEVLERTRIMEKAGQRGNEAELQEWLAKTKRGLQVLNPKLDTDRPSDFIKKILDQKLARVRITSLSWIKANNKIKFSVSGVAPDRQTLIAFENRINASGYFSEVSLPISNLAKEKNIEFQIKFSPAASTTRATTP